MKLHKTHQLHESKIDTKTKQTKYICAAHIIAFMKS